MILEILKFEQNLAELLNISNTYEIRGVMLEVGTQIRKFVTVYFTYK